MIVSPFLSPSFQNSYLSLVFFPLPVLVVLVPTPTPLLPIPPLATSGGVSHPYPYNSCNVVTLARCSYSCSHLVLTLFSPCSHPYPPYPYTPIYPYISLPAAGSRQVWRVEGQGGVVVRPVFGSGVAGSRDVEVRRSLAT